MDTFPAFSDLGPTRALWLSVNQVLLVTGMCPILGTSYSQKAAGEEIDNKPMPLGPRPLSRRPELTEQSRKV